MFGGPGYKGLPTRVFGARTLPDIGAADPLQVDIGEASSTPGHYETGPTAYVEVNVPSSSAVSVRVYLNEEDASTRNDNYRTVEAGGHPYQIPAELALRNQEPKLWLAGDGVGGIAEITVSFTA